MKKILFLLFITVISLSFSACLNNKPSETKLPETYIETQTKTASSAKNKTSKPKVKATNASAALETVKKTESTETTVPKNTSSTAKRANKKNSSLTSKSTASVVRKNHSPARKTISSSKKTNTSATKALVSTTSASVKPQSNKIKIAIGSQIFTAVLYNNKSSIKFKKLLPLTLNMSELNGNEKFYYLDSSLPTDTEKIKTIHKGDIMLFGNNCIVLFYDTFNTSYSYTKIGRIDNPDELEKAVGKGNIKVKFNTE